MKNCENVTLKKIKKIIATVYTEVYNKKILKPKMRCKQLFKERDLY